MLTDPLTFSQLDICIFGALRNSTSQRKRIYNVVSIFENYKPGNSKCCHYHEIPNSKKSRQEFFADKQPLGF